MRADHARTVLSLCLVLASACGGGGTSALPPQGSAGEDGGRNPDGPDRDGSTRDSGHDVMSGDTVLCRYDDEDLVELEANATRAGLSTATDERGFALLHHAEDGALLIEAMAAGEPAQPTVRLVAAADAPGRALIASARNTFAMLWMDGDALSVRLLAEGAGSHALSSSVLGAEGSELFAFAGADGGYWAAYAVNEGDQTLARIQAVDLEGAPMGEPVGIALPDDSEPGHLELARVDAGFLLAYSEPDPDSEIDGAIRVVGIALDALLEPRGEPVVLSKKPAHELPFALDSRAESAGVIFQALEGGVRPAVKVQRVETDGSAPLDTWNVVSAPRRAQDGSIGAFGQGFAVAYRALSSLGNETPAIRVAFVDAAGLVVHDAELAKTTEDGGPTSVRSTTKGKLLVSWVHVSGGSRVTKAIQLDCPGALILCGGKVE